MIPVDYSSYNGVKNRIGGTFYLAIILIAFN